MGSNTQKKSGDDDSIGVDISGKIDVGGFTVGFKDGRLSIRS